MNQTKLNYAMQRVKDIERLKLAALHEKLTTPGTKVSGKEILEMIRNGTMPFNKKGCMTSVEQYTDAHYIFDFEAVGKPEKFDQKKYDVGAKEITKKAGKIRDQIMLGDELVALNLITEFAGE